MLFGHENLGINTSYVEISVKLVKHLVMAKHFTPVYPFRIILKKVSPSRFLVKMFIIVLVPRNLIMGGARPDSILSPFWKSSHRLVSKRKILSEVFYLTTR